MAAPAVAARLLAARNVRRWLGCGCLAAIGVVGLPVFMLFSMASGMLQGLSASGAGQADGLVGGSATVVVGTAEPLPSGRFTVSQGFGCTSFRAEPSPPTPYSCPPDAAHPSATRFHTGIDLAAGAGVLVLAVAPGTIRVVESTAGFGVHILLTAAGSSPPVVYLYGHLDGVAVPDGDTVRAGEPIGFVGSTGNSSGPHLHFEVDVGGVPVNPCSTFPAGYLVPAGVAAAGCLAWAL